jgi:hypothetical protein
MEDDLNFLENRRQPQLLWKWKPTLIFGNERQPQLFEMEEDLNFFLKNGR